ncbi:hypothetical protein ACIGNW_00160 [Streptomyces sp. NPDC053707]|uniref:hypothetical protein n=1 Tax=Streptomyces sp. NPDC053707 TaxID=3365712 RepID=UPI0037CF5153
MTTTTDRSSTMSITRIFIRAGISGAGLAVGTVLLLELRPIGFLYLMAAVLAFPRHTTTKKG